MSTNSGAVQVFPCSGSFFLSSKRFAFYSLRKIRSTFPQELRFFSLASVEIDTSVDRANLTDDLRDLLQNLHNFYLLPSWDGHIMPFIYEEEANRL